MEACRFCGSRDVHTRQYGQPTQDCVEYLRKLSYERDRLKEAADAVVQSKGSAAALITTIKQLEAVLESIE